MTPPRRCPGCPTPPGTPCPAVDGVHRAPHPRYCELVAADPAVWAPKVLSRARADAGDALPPDRTGPSPSRELVIAHYRADLGWLADVPPIVDRITVYTKGPECEVPDDPRIQVVKRPNRGREAEVIAAHVDWAWDSLAGVTLFSQDNPFEHCPDFLSRLEHPYAEPTPLSVGHPSAPIEAWITARDRIEEHFGHEVRYGDATVHAHPGVPAWFNEKAWDYLFAEHMPRPLWFAYGAQWAVPRDRLTHRPRAFWRHLASEIVRGETARPMSSYTVPPLNPWSAEALWRYVFNDTPLNPAFLPAVPAQTHESPATATTSNLTIQQVRKASREAVERQQRAKACPHRRELTPDERAACGCRGRVTAKCAAGRSRRDNGYVLLDECVACPLKEES